MKGMIFEEEPAPGFERGRKKLMTDAELLARLNEIGEKPEHAKERRRLRAILASRQYAARQRAEQNQGRK